MNSFTFIAISLAFVVAASAVPEEDLPHNDFFSQTLACIPGQRFIDQCNVCVCGRNGNGAACTQMACRPPVEPRIDGFTSTEGLACQPGKKFSDNCNSCTCNKDGKTARCTLVAGCNVHARSRRSAPPARPNLPHIDNFSEANECTPGQHFYNQCNACTCAKDGKSAACTYAACPRTEKIRIDNYVQGMKCPAGKVFYDKCNSCNCGTDGISAGCTFKLCPDFE